MHTAPLSVNDHVKVFDPSLFINDTVTPSNVTLKEATIIRIYQDKEFRDVVDVRFNYDGRISKSHFIWGIKQ